MGDLDFASSASVLNTMHLYGPKKNVLATNRAVTNNPK